MNDIFCILFFGLAIAYFVGINYLCKFILNCYDKKIEAKPQDEKKEILNSEMGILLTSDKNTKTSKENVPDSINFMELIEQESKYLLNYF